MHTQVGSRSTALAPRFLPGEGEQDETEELVKSCSFVSLPQPMGSSTSQIGTAMNDWVLEGANRHKASYTENKNLLEKKISI